MTETGLLDGEQVLPRARLTIEVGPGYLRMVNQEAKQRGLSLRQFTLQAIKEKLEGKAAVAELSERLEALSKRNWTLVIKDKTGAEVCKLESTLLPVLLSTDPRIIDAFLGNKSKQP